MDVRRYNYTHQFGPDTEPLIAELRRMLLEGAYILGPEVAVFEEEFARYLSMKHVCGVNSGTDALTIALSAAGVGPGDEVVTQANTFYATVAAICNVGARPVLVDADENTFLIDTTAAAGALSKRTKALIPVHLYGKPTPMQPLLAAANKWNVTIIEDAAQAVGASLDGIPCGSSGRMGCFSFHPSKNLAAAGDAGAIVTNDGELAKNIRIRRELGQARQNDHIIVGVNSKMDAIQARILSWKLGCVDNWTTRRGAVAAAYRSALRDLPVQFQRCDPNEVHAYHLFQLRTPERDCLLDYLRARGIDAVIRYPVAIHQQPAFADRGWCAGQFPVAERLAAELLCLPIRPDMEPSEVDQVVQAVRGYFGR